MTFKYHGRFRIPPVIAISAAWVLAGACAMRNPVSPKPVATGMTVLQKDIIGKLSGAEEIRQGMKLVNRFSPENKQEARAYLSKLLKRLGLQPKQNRVPTTPPSAAWAIKPWASPRNTETKIRLHSSTGLEMPSKL